MRTERITCLADIVALERTPLWQRMPAGNTYELLRCAAQAHADRPALVFLPDGTQQTPAVRYSHGELFSRITQAANLFHSLGVGPQDVVSFLLPSLPETHFVLWGAQAAGIVNPINILLQPDQIVGLLNASRTKVLVALDAHPGFDVWSKVSSLAQRVPNLKAIVPVSLDDAPVGSLQARLAEYPGDRLLSARRIEPDAIAAYFHTGGTTGAPKLARLSHGNIAHAAYMGALQYAMTETDCLMHGLPLFHVGGTIICSLSPLIAGGSVVMLSPSGMRNPQVIANFWKHVECYRPTIIAAVPTAMNAASAVPRGDADVSCVDMAISGAAPLPGPVAEAFELQSGAEIHEMLGMTETAGVTAVDPRCSERRSGTVGLRLPYEQVRTVRLRGDGTLGEDCASGEAGMFLVKGPNVFSGYLDERDSAAAFTPDGWYISGDLARIDADGYIQIVGRVKDLIIRGGHNIDPAWIEEALGRHPAVQMCAAVGQPDRYAGEVPVAFVSLKSGAQVSVEELLAFASEYIAERPALPRQIFVLDALPMTGVGKIFKPQLRCDAMTRVIDVELAPVLQATGTDASWQVSIAPEHGAVATITVVSSRQPEQFRAEVSRILASFKIHLRLQGNE